MSTLIVVEKVLRERAIPMVVREIVEAAGSELPSRSRTPDTVVARDLAMEIKRNGEASKFVRTSPGKYTLRELAAPYLAPHLAPHLAPVLAPVLASGSALPTDQAHAASSAQPAVSMPQVPSEPLQAPAQPRV